MSGILSPYNAVSTKDYDIANVNKDKVLSALSTIIAAAKPHDLSAYEATLNNDEQYYLLELIEKREDIQTEAK